MVRISDISILNDFFVLFIQIQDLQATCVLPRTRPPYKSHGPRRLQRSAGIGSTSPATPHHAQSRMRSILVQRGRTWSSGLRNCSRSMSTQSWSGPCWMLPMISRSSMAMNILKQALLQVGLCSSVKDCSKDNSPTGLPPTDTILQ